MGLALGTKKETLQKALDPRCWVYRAREWEAGRKEAERRQRWPEACPGPGWVNYATGSRRFGSKERSDQVWAGSRFKDTADEPHP